MCVPSSIFFKTHIALYLSVGECMRHAAPSSKFWDLEALSFKCFFNWNDVHTLVNNNKLKAVLWCKKHILSAILWPIFNRITHSIMIFYTVTSRLFQVPASALKLKVCISRHILCGRGRQWDSTVGPCFLKITLQVAHGRSCCLLLRTLVTYCHMSCITYQLSFVCHISFGYNI